MIVQKLQRGRTRRQRQILSVLMVLGNWGHVFAETHKDIAPDPALTIPFCTKPPTIDGELAPGEWQYAAGVSMLEAYPWRTPRVMREEQPRFYVCWDDQYLYLAMDSLESPYNQIVARCVQNDDKRIIGDDCMEFMVAPGAGDDLKDPDFPTFYLAANSLGTLWDSKFVPMRAEAHNSWQSNAQTAHRVDGTRWVCEMRVPFASVSAKPPADGDVWRMNFDRTYYGYWWNAWNASGGLNDARRGGDVTFRRAAPAVRLLSVEDVIGAKLKILMEIANSTDSPKTVVLNVTATGYDEEGQTPVELGGDTKEVSVKPGECQEVTIGKEQRLRRFNTVTLTATEKGGERLFFVQRDVHVPSPRIPRKLAPELPLVYVFPRFLPSLERLAVEMDCTAWIQKQDEPDAAFKAEITVHAEASQEKPVLQGVFTDFRAGKGVWRHSTKELPEGEYTVLVEVVSGDKELVRHDDWFEKRIFDWMVHKRGIGDQVPTPYTPLIVNGRSVRPWGRDYRFGANGLPVAIVSQQKPLLSGPVTLQATVDGRAAPPEVTRPFSTASAKPAQVEGQAELALGAMTARIESTTEYDGLTRFRVTYGPAEQTVTVNRMRLRVPLAADYCRFYSASGDREGTSIQGEVLPTRQGRLFDSKTDTYCVGGSPTFATLFWVGDYDTYFCYAADNGQGWAVRDDAPAVEVHREGDEVVLWLNLVDRELTLSAPRTLEFAFQAGPMKPLPKGWRGIQFGGDPKAAPTTLNMIGGSGFTLYGGPNFIHPGLTPEAREKSRKHIKAKAKPGPYTILGYHRWPAAVKAHPAFRVFRGEWGIDKAAWERGGQVSWSWPKRLYGEDKDLHTLFLIKPVPSYVDYLIYAYDEALKETDLYGTYDDTGYPISIYDEELGLGYVRDDGRQVASSGLWIYRDRWQRAAYVHSLRGRPNYTCDSQHVQAHFQPAYGFIGIWAPCERGYYNHHPDRDNLDFYGSLERYYAYNPSHAFGQIPCAVGMGTPQKHLGPMVRDTRVMMMLALLHDQDVGTFGHRDMRTVARLRAARNLFRQWADDVSFTGYWEPDLPVRVENEDFRVSLYRRPGSALLIVANVGDTDGSSRITLDWKALGVNPETARLADPETGRDIRRQDAGFAVELPRHDVQLVLAGDLSGYAYRYVSPGNDLPRPKTVLQEWSDPLRGPEFDPAWTVDLHPGNSSTGFVDGRCFIQYAHYGYAHIRRKLDQDNVSVQCMILSSPTGGSDAHCAGLSLWWDSGEFVRAIPGYNQHKFYYEVKGMRPAHGGAINTEAAPRWYPYAANGVKIQLTPDTVRSFVSTDGKTWHQDHEVRRTVAMAGAPAWVILGNGGSQGPKPLFKNVVSQHFVPERANRVTAFTDFVVGGE